MNRISRHRQLVILSLIILVAIVVRIVTFAGMVGADDLSIASNAINIVENGLKTPQSHYGLRTGLTIPLAGIFAALGVGEWQLALFPLIFSLIGIFTAYGIGKYVAGSEVGLLAASLLAIFPLDVLYATKLFPDSPLGVTLALSFYLALRARKPEYSRSCLVASGLLWGYAYLIKVEAVFMGLVFVAMMLYERRHWRQVFMIIVIFGLVVLSEQMVYFINTGEFLYRFHIIKKISMKVSKEYSMSQLWVFPKAWFITFYEFGLYYYFLFVALVWAIIKRQKPIYLLLIWVVVYLLWLEFGTSDPFASTYRAKSHLLRYCGMINVPLCVIIAFFLWKMGILHKSYVQIMSIVLIVFPALFFANFNTLNSEREQATKRGIQYAVEQKLFPLYLDRTSSGIARFLLYGNKERDNVHSLQAHNFATGETTIMSLDNFNGYILLNRAFMLFKSQRYFMKQLNIDYLKSNHDLVYTINNPMNRIAYLQAKLLVFLSSYIPVYFIKEKVNHTGKKLLEGDDVLIFRISNM